MEKIYDLEDRLVRFAAEAVKFCASIPKNDAGSYYSNQLIRLTGSSALNFGEAKATQTKKDFIHKLSTSAKELGESKINLKILHHLEYGQKLKREWLLEETLELMSIECKMILNKK